MDVDSLFSKDEDKDTFIVPLDMSSWTLEGSF